MSVTNPKMTLGLGIRFTSITTMEVYQFGCFSFLFFSIMEGRTWNQYNLGLVLRALTYILEDLGLIPSIQYGSQTITPVPGTLLVSTGNSHELVHRHTSLHIRLQKQNHILYSCCVSFFSGAMHHHLFAPDSEPVIDPSNKSTKGHIPP